MRKFKEKQAVYWNDPAGETSGVYEVLDTNEEYNAGIAEAEIPGFDSRVLLIGNGMSEAEVYAEELSVIDPPSSESRAWSKRTWRTVSGGLSGITAANRIMPSVPLPGMTAAAIRKSISGFRKRRIRKRTTAFFSIATDWKASSHSLFPVWKSFT